MKINFTLLFLILVISSQAQDWSQLHKSNSLHREAEANYGISVDISGDEAVIGTFSEDSDENGLNPLAEAGAVYVLNFDNQSGEWIASQKLVAQPRELNESFGVDAAIDGSYMIVAAKSSDLDAEGNNALDDAGAAYIFEKTGDTWTQVQKIVASDRAEYNYFGSAVAISGDYAIVIASNNGTDTNNANELLNAGAGYIFHRGGDGVWSQVQKIVASDRAIMDFFGNSVDMDGDNIIVAAYFEDHDFQGNNALAEAGSVYLFSLNDQNTWVESAKLTALDRSVADFFGSSVAINGDNIVIGARQEDEDAGGGNTLAQAGSVYIFHNDGNDNWLQDQKIVSSDRALGDLFGFSVDIFEDNIIVGARSEDEDVDGLNTVNSAGSSYIFNNIGGTWVESQKIVAEDRHSSDFFGAAVSISNGLMMIGAKGNDTDQNDENNLNSSGAVYVYTACVASVTDIPLSICQGDSVLIGESYQSTTGDYIVSTIDTLGCVSSINYQLMVNDFLVSTQNLEACQGETIEVNGNLYTESTSFVEIGTGDCPDTTYYNLTFNISPLLSVDIPFCPGDSVLAEGNYYSQTTEFTVVTDTTVFGCPSSTNYNISMLTPMDVQVFEDICQGDVLVINGTEITESGNYPEPSEDTFGCDIVIMHEVTVHSTEDSETTDTLCDGESIEIDGNNITEGGKYTAQETDEWGCISTVTHTVVFNPIPVVDLGDDVTICDTLEFVLDAGAGFDNYVWSDNSTNQILEITNAGIYTVTVTDLGCSASDEVEITIYTCVGIDELSYSELEVYPNPAAGTIYFENINSKFERFIIYNENGQIVKESNLSSINSIDVKELSSGLYMIDFLGKKSIQKARFIKK